MLEVCHSELSHHLQRQQSKVAMVQVLTAILPTQLPANESEKAVMMTQMLPHGRPGSSSCLLASVWPSPGSHSHLRTNQSLLGSSED